MALVVQYQMASELHGMLAGNVSMVTGDNMKPAYGGDDESFLSLVVTPIYEVIAKVFPLILIKLHEADSQLIDMYSIFFRIKVGLL